MILSHRGNDALFLLLVLVCFGHIVVKEATGFLNPSPFNRAFHDAWVTSTTTITITIPSALTATPLLSYSRRLATTTLHAGGAENEEEEDDDDDEDLSDDEVDVFLDEQLVLPEMKDLKGAELAWRYAKKPLLRIGVKGATMTHGNSLRQLLEAHTVVKVKVNTQKFGGTYQLK
jgi:hypothetical protein